MPRGDARVQFPQGVWAAIPVKDIVNAKQRLSPVLAAGERRELFRAMLRDVLTALCQARGLAGIALVTKDTEVRVLAAGFGVEVLPEPDNNGHTAAVVYAAQALIRRKVTAMITVPGDIPRVTGAEIDAVIAAHRPGTAITISPARDNMGSNAVLCSPPDALPFRFGENSFYPHLDKARALGIEPTVIAQPGIGLDVDEPADLLAFAAEPSDTQTYKYLQSSGIARRILANGADG